MNTDQIIMETSTSVCEFTHISYDGQRVWQCIQKGCNGYEHYMQVRK